MSSDDSLPEASDVGNLPPEPGDDTTGEPPDSTGSSGRQTATLLDVWRNRGPRHRALVLAALIITVGVAWIALRPEGDTAGTDVGVSAAADACRPVLDALENPAPGGNPLIGAGFATDEVPLALAEAGIRTYQCVADETGSNVLAVHADIGTGESRGSLFLLSPAASPDLAPAWLEGTGSPWAGSDAVAAGAWRFYGSPGDRLYRDLDRAVSEGTVPPLVSLFEALVARGPAPVHPQG